MIFKMQKPIFSSDEGTYLVYNKDRSIMSQSLKVGQVKEIDGLFDENEVTIYVKGYIDRKDNLVINKKVEMQDW